MVLERLFWDEDKGSFVRFNLRTKIVQPIPIGFPVGFFVCIPERDGMTDEQNIAEHSPKGSNAYCSGKIHLPDMDCSPQRSSYEVQYYQI
jgi:regulation of enolase protein 1 (concanavalin A-like superfamily)